MISAPTYLGYVNTPHQFHSRIRPIPDAEDRVTYSPVRWPSSCTGPRASSPSAPTRAPGFWRGGPRAASRGRVPPRPSASGAGQPRRLTSSSRSGRHFRGYTSRRRASNRRGGLTVISSSGERASVVNFQRQNDLWFSLVRSAKCHAIPSISCLPSIDRFDTYMYEDEDMLQLTEPST